MVDRIAIIGENGRSSLRGMSARGPNDFEVWQDLTENPLYTLDLSGLLGSATISSVVRTALGVAVTAPSNTTTRVLQRLAQQGQVQISVTASDGQVFDYRITVSPKGAVRPVYDYGWIFP